MVEMIYMDEEGIAENPGELSLSMKKLKDFHPSFFGGLKCIRKVFNIDKADEKKIQILREHLYYGQIEPAVVLVAKPSLLIAVHSTDMDCILLLLFSNSLTKKYSLSKGTRLLSINTYGKENHSDVVCGPDSTHDWNSFWPVIADFVSDDVSKIQSLKEKIPNDVWTKAYEMGKKKLQEDIIKYRYGDPLLSCLPLKSYSIKKRKR